MILQNILEAKQFFPDLREEQETCAPHVGMIAGLQDGDGVVPAVLRTYIAYFIHGIPANYCTICNFDY